MTEFTLSEAEVEDHIIKCYSVSRRAEVIQWIHDGNTLTEGLLIFACATGRFEAFDDLVARGFRDADSIRDGQGRTLYHLAAYYWHPRIMTRLIEMGADPMTLDVLGANPFGSAMVSKKRITENKVKTLVGLHPPYAWSESSHHYRFTCLHFEDMPPWCMRILLEAGAWKVLNRTAPHCENPHWTVVDYICDRGCDEYRLDQLALLVAWGGRVGVPAHPSRGREVDEYEDEGVHDYRTVMARLRACGRAAVIVMGLAKLRSPVARGNGRDALRLVARMAWAYRVDEEWDVGRVESKSKKQ